MLNGEHPLTLCDVCFIGGMASSITDTSRHYYPIDVIKHILDSMSFAKLVRYDNSQFLLALILSALFLKHYTDHYSMFCSFNSSHGNYIL